MFANNTNAIIKSTITANAASLGSYDPAGSETGLLAPEQSSAFIDMVMDESTFLKEVTYEKKSVIEGTISQLGVSPLNLRKKNRE